jgi:hypothetical protein
MRTTTRLPFPVPLLLAAWCAVGWMAPGAHAEPPDGSAVSGESRLFPAAGPSLPVPRPATPAGPGIGMVVPEVADQPSFPPPVAVERPTVLFPALWSPPGQGSGQRPEPSEKDNPLTGRPPSAGPGEPRPGGDSATKSVGWQKEEVVPLPLPGQFFLFGRVGAGEGPQPARELNVTGRTGVGWKLAPAAGTEVLFRSGPALSCTDRLPPDRALDDSQLFLEMQCRWRLLEWAGLEYQGTALPALSPTAHGRLDQDLGLVVPLGKAGQLRLGTKYSWESTSEFQPWMDGLRLQLGSSLKW